MTTPDWIQTPKTYNGNVASLTHVITLDNPTRAPGGYITPSTLILAGGYGGATLDQIASITDDKGNTWGQGGHAGDSSNTEGEGWVAFNVIPGTQVITVTLSSSLPFVAIVAEIDQVAPQLPDGSAGNCLDRVSNNVITAGGTNRLNTATSTRRGQREVIVNIGVWNSTTISCNGGGAGWTGMNTIQDGTSGLGVAIDHPSLDRPGMAGVQGRLSFTPSSVIPVAMITMTFYRVGVMVTTTEDGMIDAFGGPYTVYKNSGMWVMFTSLSAPDPTNPGSEVTYAFAFIPQFQGVPSGVTLDSVVMAGYDILAAADDGSGLMQFSLSTSKTAALGTTLTLGDQSAAMDNTISLSTSDILTAGAHEIALDLTTDINQSGTTNLRWNGIPGSSICGNYGQIGTIDTDNDGAYLIYKLIYPSGAPLRTLMGVGT